MIPSPQAVERPWLPHLVGTGLVQTETIYFKAGGSVHAQKLGAVSAWLWKAAKGDPDEYAKRVNAWVAKHGARIFLPSETVPA